VRKEALEQLEAWLMSLVYEKKRAKHRTVDDLNGGELVEL